MRDNLQNLYDSNKKLIVQYALEKNRTFKMNVEAVETQCLSITDIEEESNMWRKRLGHLNFKSLGHLSSKNIVQGIPNIAAQVKSCDVCMRDKKSRLPFTSKLPPRATHALGVVDSYVCGPFEVTPLGGNRYFYFIFG